MKRKRRVLYDTMVDSIFLNLTQEKCRLVLGEPTWVAKKGEEVLQISEPIEVAGFVDHSKKYHVIKIRHKDKNGTTREGWSYEDNFSKD